MSLGSFKECHKADAGKECGPCYFGICRMNCRYTGQRWEAGLGLYDYKERFYDPALGHFLQPDVLVPEPGNPQSLNRYAYVYNNTLRYVDGSGHLPVMSLPVAGRWCC